MQGNTGVLRLIVAVVACATHLVAFRVLAPQEVQVEMRQYVAAQAHAELMVRGSDVPRVSAATVRLEHVAKIANDLDVWRATLPSDHSHPYLLVSMKGKLIGLGGFTSPGLTSIAPVLRNGDLTAKRIRRRAEQLALLSDPNGAIQVVLLESADRPSYLSTVAVAWSKGKPADWPPDTVVTSEAGGWLVRLTLLSRDTRSFTLHWLPRVVSFNFDREGRLTAWGSRTGEFFGVAGVPVAPTGGFDRR